MPSMLLSEPVDGALCTIVNAKSGKALEFTDGTKSAPWRVNCSEPVPAQQNQLWRLKKSEAGFQILSECGGLPACLDVFWGKEQGKGCFDAGCAEVAKGHSWNLVPAGDKGEYFLEIQGLESKDELVLDGYTRNTTATGHACGTYKKNGGANQKWKVECPCPPDGAVYVISNMDTKGALDQKAAGLFGGSGKDVCTYTKHGKKNQKWKLERLPSGNYLIISESLQLPLAAAIDKAAPEKWAKNVACEDKTGALNQQWGLTCVGADEYLIDSKDFLGEGFSEIVLDEGGMGSVGTCKRSGEAKQVWKFELVDDDDNDDKK
eukprot:CAMPEP_0206243426 /NCGR_PEP_ID=MMETSP0047_2-20121206/17600_1 /ASSEMBLY_ACC=CAM_ASM_000192 /TAXON_ID=195065 /ORGANISM="Chroomonas mesostigmatica_cf, Strain CCMP1168" /LENGTH=318 /DNA_ID=CAMNT_0053668543 /DNA_START=43 /DNA_END=999 /DNA_ORIENTATION=+